METTPARSGAGSGKTLSVLRVDLNSALKTAWRRQEFHVPYGYERDILDAMDIYLVASNHELAQRAGTQEQRFAELARIGHQFDPDARADESKGV